jgi:hypothetical protein
MSIFKSIDKSNVLITETTLYKKQSLHSGSSGINSTQYRSGSELVGSNNRSDISGSYWESLRVLYYLSGSLEGTGSDATRYNQPPSSLANWALSNTPQRVNKFYMSGSILSIPQKYFGERIKPKSFKLIDNSTSKEVTIQDDGHGNLYPVGNSDSQSTSSPSSSDNYVGNIFYNHGVVTITDTGSYSSSINYTDVATSNYILEFNSTQTVYTYEYSIAIQPNEFNYTMNPTVRVFRSGSNLTDVNRTPWIHPQFTGSKTSDDPWWPATYINTIQLHSSNTEALGSYEVGRNQMIPLTEPVIVANLPRPIKMRDDMSMTFKIRIDI